jgi:hypothetical protein
MSKVPSIKATGFQSAADDVNRLVESGRLPRAELEARLPAGDLAYLDKALAATTWVPIESYRRIVEILVDLEANGSPEAYLHARGQRAGARLHKLGAYRQFEASTETWGRRVGKVSVTLSSVLYNFTKWNFESVDDDGSFLIVVDEASAFPEVMRFVSQGFIEYTSRAVTKGDERVTSRRPTPDRIEFRGRRER